MGTKIAQILHGLIFFERGSVCPVATNTGNRLEVKSQFSRALSRRCERGAVFFESLIAIPVLVVFVFGSVRIGRLLEERAMVGEVVRIASRTASISGEVTASDDDDETTTSLRDIRNLIEDEIGGSGLDPASFDIMVEATSDSSVSIGVRKSASPHMPHAMLPQAHVEFNIPVRDYEAP